MKESLKIYLRLEGEEVERFLQIKEHMGLKNYTEVCRSAINNYWREHQGVQKQLEVNRFRKTYSGLGRTPLY